MERETEIRKQILHEQSELIAGDALGYSGEPVASVARELLFEGLVTGSDSGSVVTLTGIRDAGREVLKNQTARRKLWRILKKILFVVYSAALVLLGYIFGLDSVKDFFSDLVGQWLK